MDSSGRGWSCSRCTYDNHPDLTTCEICGAYRMPSLPNSLQGAATHYLSSNHHSSPPSLGTPSAHNLSEWEDVEQAVQNSQGKAWQDWVDKRQISKLEMSDSEPKSVESCDSVCLSRRNAHDVLQSEDKGHSQSFVSRSSVLVNNLETFSFISGLSGGRNHRATATACQETDCYCHSDKRVLGHRRTGSAGDAAQRRNSRGEVRLLSDPVRERLRPESGYNSGSDSRTHSGGSRGGSRSFGYYDALVRGVGEAPRSSEENIE